jgi:PAS domain S-box-containing protein
MERSRPQFKVAHLFSLGSRPAGDDGGLHVGDGDSREAVARMPYEGLEHALLFLSDAVAVVDVCGRVLQWNPAAERLFGWGPREAVGRTIDDVLPTWYPFEDDAMLLCKVMRDGAWNGEVIQKGRDGGLLKTMASLTLLRGDAGYWSCALLTFRSIREIRELDQPDEEQLLSSPWRSLATSSTSTRPARRCWV